MARRHFKLRWGKGADHLAFGSELANIITGRCRHCAGRKELFEIAAIDESIAQFLAANDLGTALADTRKAQGNDGIDRQIDVGSDSTASAGQVIDANLLHPIRAQHGGSANA